MNKKEAILAAGTRLFAEKGFNGASMATLAEMTHIAGATIFYHFKNKEDLFLAVLEGVSSGILTAFQDHFANRSFSSGLEKVETAISFYLDLTSQHEDWFLLLQTNHPHQMAEVNPIYRGHLEAICNCFVDFFEQAIVQGQSDGSIREVPPRHAALILLSMVEGVARLNTGRVCSTGALHETFIALCKDMLKITQTVTHNRGVE